METTTSFDLNRAIQQWREELAQSPAIHAENLDELETHLRDSIANLNQQGLTTDEAFLIASRRIGHSSVLSQEFCKVNSRKVWLNRALWMLIGIQALALVQGISTITTVGMTTAMVLWGEPVQNFGRMPWLLGALGAFAHLLAFTALLILGWRFLVGKSKLKSAWPQIALNNPTRLAAMCLAIVVLTRLVAGSSSAILARSLGPDISGHLFVVMSYGSLSASLVETLALMILTLLLARRELLAKTSA